MIADPKLASARADAEAARLKLAASMKAAKARLSPATLASDAIDGVKSKAGEIAANGVEAVRSRPAITVAALAAIGLVFARKPIARVIGHGGSDDETGGA